MMTDVTSRPTSEQIDVRDLATLVAGLSRFLTRLSNIPPFQEAGLGLAEWSALSIIADKKGLNNRQLANMLGVSAQRANQITDSLRTAVYVSLNPSPDDARKKIICITSGGAARLKDLNAKLQPIIAAALGKRPTSLSRASRAVSKTLMRIVASPKSLERKVFR